MARLAAWRNSHGLLPATMYVLACSALKTAYRERLLEGPEVKLVYLEADENSSAQRLAAAAVVHYMNPRLSGRASSRRWRSHGKR